MNKQNYVPTEKERIFLAALINGGFTAEEIAEHMGRSPRNVYLRLALHGLSKSRKVKRPRYCSCGISIDWLKEHEDPQYRRVLRS